MAADCGSTCPVPEGFLSYDPSVAGNAVLLAAFAIALPLVLFTGARFRTPIFSAVLTTALLLEILGFVGRILLHGNQDSQTYFTLFLLGTLLGPAFMSLAIFLVLPHTLSVYGENLSPLRPAFAGFLLCGLIIIAIILQVVGLVFAAYGPSDMSSMTSVDIVAGGLGLQTVGLVLFSGLHVYFTLGLITRRGEMSPKHATVYMAPKFTRFLRAMEAATVLLLGYTIYRIIEMTSGIDGNLFQNEVAFMVVCGAIPLISCILLASFPPGFAFGNAWGSTSLRRRSKRQAPPLHIEHIPAGFETHHRYDPNIRKQISPTSQRHQRVSSSIHGGSPGLPPNPRPGYKPPSPGMAQPGSTQSSPRTMQPGSSQSSPQFMHHGSAQSSPQFMQPGSSQSSPRFMHSGSSQPSPGIVHPAPLRMSPTDSRYGGRVILERPPQERRQKDLVDADALW